MTQMFIGTGVCASAWYFKLKGHSCNNEDSNLIAGGLMYGSYLYLFCEFALKRYDNQIKRGGIRRNAKKQKE